MLDVKRFKSYPHTGFRFGAVSYIPLTKHLELQPALLFTQKGFEVNYDAVADPNGYSVIYSPNYLELPVNIAYTQSLTKKISAFIGTGPVKYGRWRQIEESWFHWRYQYERNA